MGTKWATALDNIIVAAVTAVLIMNSAKSPLAVSEALADRQWAVAAMLVVAPLWAGFKPLSTLAQPRRDDQSRPVRSRCQETLKALIELGLQQDCDYDLSDPGVHVWKPRRSFRHPLRPRLTRTASYRLGAGEQTNRPFAPKKGHGVVGLCWRDNTEKSVDVASLAAVLKDRAAFDEHRTRHGRDEVMGLDWDTFQKVKHRGLVAAAPVQGRKKFKGCVSVDLATGDAAMLAELCRQAVALAGSIGAEDLTRA